MWKSHHVAKNCTTLIMAWLQKGKKIILVVQPLRFLTLFAFFVSRGDTVSEGKKYQCYDGKLQR